MKVISKHISRWFMLGMVALSALLVSSCEDEPDKYEIAGGTPEVIYIRTPQRPDSLLTSAFLGTRIVLVGSNLRSVTEVYFNDVKAVLSTSFITDNTLFVTVPNALPGDKTNIMYLINSDKDTTKVPFEAQIPPPVLSSMACELVKPGEVATIIGDYLLTYDNSPMVITMPDGKSITEFNRLSKTQVSFVVPEGCTKSGPVSVTTAYGTTSSTRFHFNDERGMLFDFDGKTGLTNHGWHPRDILSDATSITGNFVQLGNGSAKMSKDGGWDDGNFAFEYWCGDWNDPQLFQGTDIRLTDLVDFTNWNKMALKFELYIPTTSAWSAGAMQLIFAGTDLVTLSPNSGYPGANNTFFQGNELPRGLYRPWESTGSFDTGDKWITVTVPFSDFKYGMDGSAAKGSLNASSFASFTLFVVSGGINGVDCTPLFKVDNIRAVPFK
ncbi:MAG: IPT/TIG domain-containing protein [Marinilabiliaceae bacterium]|nr:IPT/TIG domain-containing protein [Marinilabiliaceae bacterium]